MAFRAPIRNYEPASIQPPAEPDSFMGTILGKLGQALSAPGTEALIGGPMSAVGPVSGIASKYEQWFKNLAVKHAQEAQGQAVLDGLEDIGRTPREVVSDFWGGAYHRLPEETKQRFHTMINRLTGFRPGSIIGSKPGANGTREDIIPQNWAEVYPAEQAASAVEHLEGTERGLISLMEMANARHANTSYKLLPDKY